MTQITFIAFAYVAQLVLIMFICFIRDAVVERKRLLDHYYAVARSFDSDLIITPLTTIACVIPIAHYTNEQLIPLMKEWAAFRGHKWSKLMEDPTNIKRDAVIELLLKETHPFDIGGFVD